MVSTRLAADVSTVNDALSVEVTNLRNFDARASLYGPRILPMVSEMGAHLEVSCGIVCSLSDVFYMDVSPDEPQWITCDKAIIYEVASNVKWNVE
jgi:hypothetical protein